MKSINPLLLPIEDGPHFQMLLDTTLKSQDYQVFAHATGI